MSNISFSHPIFASFSIAKFSKWRYFLRFCSIEAAKSDPNLGANSASLFIREP